MISEADIRYEMNKAVHYPPFRVCDAGLSLDNSCLLHDLLKWKEGRFKCVKKTHVAI